MTGLPTLDLAVIEAIKKLMDNFKNDVDPYESMDQITDLVEEQKLYGKEAYKPLLKSVCDAMREKGFPQTADFLEKQWRLQE